MRDERIEGATPGRTPWALIAILGVGVLIGAVGTAGMRATSVKAGSAALLPGAESPFIKVAEQVLPGVVSVESRRLFHHPPVEPDSTGEMAIPPGGDIVVPSSGSGFIIDGSGHILTNNHVVAGSSDIIVHLADGRRMAAKVVGTDPQTDLAVLKVDSRESLPVVPLGDSDALKIGEWVAAVGNPLGVLEGTLTVGVVSAKKRTEIQISGSSPAYQDFIQTDAAINFGNSGGPLVNTRGEAVGINTAFGGPGKGIGFAVSINMAKGVARSLIDEGRVKRGYLGVVLQRLDPGLAKGLGLSETKGVLLRDVQPQMPAAQAGLRAGDVILAFDGLPVASLSDFRLQVARTDVGSQVSIRYFREGREETARVKVAERPDIEQASTEAAPAPSSTTDLGLELSAPPPGSDLDGGDGGVVVSKVADGSLSDRAGLEMGDVILQIDGRSAGSPDSSMAVIRRDQKADHPSVVRVQRGNDRWFVALPFGVPVEEESEMDR